MRSSFVRPRRQPSSLMALLSRASVVLAAAVYAVVAALSTTSDAAASDAPVPDAPQTVDAVVIKIHGVIDSVLAASLQRRVNEAIDSGAKAIVFDFDTPGGEVGAAFDICETIESLQGKARTIAWISNHALSAGAMIAITCDTIAMSDNATIGDCQPIIPSADEIKPAGEKIESPLRAHFRKCATRNGYPAALAEAMVSADMEVVELTVRPKIAFGADSDENVVGNVDGDDHADTPHRSQRLPAALRYVERSDFEAREDRDNFIAKPVVAAGELLTLHAGEARAFGFAAVDISTWDALIEAERLNITATPGETWSEELVRILSGLGFLFLIVGMIAAYIEFKTPGFGVAGAVSIVCFAVFFGARFLMGLAGAEEVILFVVGLVLILLEVFVVPGFGVTGIAGIICLFAGIFLAGQKFILPATSYEMDVFTLNTLFLGLTIVGATLGVIAAFKILPRTPFVSRLVLAGTSTTDTERRRRVFAGNKAGNDVRVGQPAVTATTMRPGGKITIDGQSVTAQTRGEFLDPGTAVEVIEAHGNRIVIRSTEPPEPPAPPAAPDSPLTATDETSDVAGSAPDAPPASTT